MQTKKRVSGKKSGELAIPKFSRQQKKALENGQIQVEDAAKLITSSARKKKIDCSSPKSIEESNAQLNLAAGFGLLDDDTSTLFSGPDGFSGITGPSMNSKDMGGLHMKDTIFSPAFHISEGFGEISNGDTEYGRLSPEVSAIYQSMKDSKLECVEQNQDQMLADVHVEEDEGEEYDFDPYLFIKSLPDLSSVVPTFRPLLLPKQTRSCPSTTLVLDLDETLVHSTLEPCDDADFTFIVNYNLQEHTVYVRCRPHLKDFMERVSSLFEIIIFTASQSIYAEQLLNILDPKRKVFRHRVYRESCVYVDGNYLKDLSVLGRDLAHVIIIDNSPQAFGFQVDNGIPIESWFDDPSDNELLSLLPFLETLVGVEDVRPLIAKKFNLRKKIAAAVCPFDSC